MNIIRLFDNDPNIETKRWAKTGLGEENRPGVCFWNQFAKTEAQGSNFKVRYTGGLIVTDMFT